MTGGAWVGVFVALALGGCTGDIPPHGGEVSPGATPRGELGGMGGAPQTVDPCLRVGPSMSAEDFEVFVQAAEEWFEAVPGLRCPIVVSDEPNTLFLPHSLEEDDGSALLGTYADGVVILYPNAVEESGHQLRLIVLHELGHFFGGGGGHHEGPGVMVKHAETQADELTAEDVAWLQAAR